MRQRKSSAGRRREQSSPAISVLIVDDHAIVREGIRYVLAEEGDIAIVGEAANGQEALEKVRECRPDVILMDIAMPGIDGFETTRRLMSEELGGKPPKIVVLTMYDDEHYAIRLIRMGASGYLVKGAALEELPEAIRAVSEGRRFVSSSIREVLAQRCLDGAHEGPLALLTDREFEVLRLLARGNTNREIAELFSLSVKTIDNHRLNILGKLGLRNNTELARFAIRHGLDSVG